MMTLRDKVRVLVTAVATASVVSTLALVGGAASARPATHATTTSASAHRHALNVTGRRAASRLLARAQSGIPASGRHAFLLRLTTKSTFATYRHAQARGRAQARVASRGQLQRIKAAQRRVVAALPKHAHVLYRTHSVLAGVAVVINVRDYRKLRTIAGVRAVYPITPKRASTSYAVRLEKAPQVWAAPGHDLGANTTIAVVDTGIDYTHADFGGPGTAAAYQNALAHDTQDPTPTDLDSTKFAGGADLVGDSYDPDPADPGFDPNAAPDTNPLDCAGHGSHVAGIAAGYGTNPDGTKFIGDYTTLSAKSASDYQATFRIGPGMAPKAKLLAYKVFGCNGPTDFITDGIDMATDPNGDGDPSDHASVINLSVGADFTSPRDADAVEANIASALGVIVVAAAGNAGDLYDAVGSPGDARRVISVANSADAYSQVDSLHVSFGGVAQDPMAAERSVMYDWATKPDLGSVPGPPGSNTVVALTDASNRDGCDPLSVADAAAVKDKIAFLEWTDNDSTRRCGSATRSDNVTAAGATGAIFADDEETFAAGINGNASIPVVIVAKSAGDAIRTALGAGTVTATGTGANDFSQLIPGNDDTLDSSSSRGIRDAGNVKPDVAAVGNSVFSAAMGTGNDGVSFSGTSMATPMTSGLAALVRALHPFWTAEEVKAAIMNTAGHDVYTGTNRSGSKFAPNRVGAGRIDALAALSTHVLAFSKSDPGAVSVSFGPVAVVSSLTRTKTVTVENKGAGGASYSVAYRALTSVPGVSYQLSKTSLYIPAHMSTTFTITLSIPKASALRKTHDPTVDTMITTDFGDLPREFLADASGRVVLTPKTGTAPSLRVPVYSAPRPASTMKTPSTVALGTGTSKVRVGLSGHSVSQGNFSTGTGIESLLAGFELAAKSGLSPACTQTVTDVCVSSPDDRSADLKYVGVTSNAPELKQLGGNPFKCFDTPSITYCGELYFGITTQGAWRTPATEQEIDILIDTNGDGVADADTYSTRLEGADEGTDVLLAETIDLNSCTADGCDVIDDEPINDFFGDVDTAEFDSDSFVLPVSIEALDSLPGFDPLHSRIHYGLVTFGDAGIVDNRGVSIASLNTIPKLNSGRLTVDALHPGVAIYGQLSLQTDQLITDDQSGGQVIVRRDLGRFLTDKALGALVIHLHNVVGSKGRVVALKTRPKVTLTLSKSSVGAHHSISATVSVANTAGHAPTGAVVLHRGDGSKLRSGHLTNGKVTFTWKPGSKGKFVVYATYAGDAHYASGRSARVTYRVT